MQFNRSMMYLRGVTFANPGRYAVQAVTEIKIGISSSLPCSASRHELVSQRHIDRRYIGTIYIIIIRDIHADQGVEMLENVFK